LAAIVFSASAASEQPHYPLSGTVCVSGTVPVVRDWNGDGTADLVFSSLDGRITVIETASGLLQVEASRAFNLALRKASGEVVPLVLPLIIDVAPRFDLSDWNGDGTVDILALDEQWRVLVFCGVPGVACMGTFLEPIRPQFSDLTPLSLPACEPPNDPGGIRVVDWHGDGGRDLLLGLGECYLLPGTGPWASARYDRPPEWDVESWCSSDHPARDRFALFGLSGGYVVPWALDWDGNGAIDILLSYLRNTGNKWLGQIVLQVNQGTSRSYQFDASGDSDDFLLTDEGPITLGQYAAVCPFDADGDAKWDLLVGGDGPLSLYQGIGSRSFSRLWEVTDLVVP
jgi:hypothetical protein